MNDQKIYCVDLSIGEMIKTDIKTLEDIDQIKSFDNAIYGESFQ